MYELFATDILALNFDHVSVQVWEVEDERTCRKGNDVWSDLIYECKIFLIWWLHPFLAQEHWHSFLAGFPPAIFACWRFYSLADLALNVQPLCFLDLNAFPSSLYWIETVFVVLNTLLLYQWILFGRFWVDSDFCLNKKAIYRKKESTKNTYIQ